MNPTPPDDHWHEGDPYERYIGRWSRPVAAAFLAWLDQPASLRWLDIGCGTGALTAAIATQAQPASLVGVDPSPGFLAKARERVAGATFRVADALALPLADATADVVVSGLVLNFVADTGRGLAEMRRVCAPGGTVAAYVWDYAAKMALIRHFWNAAVALDPAARALDEGVRFPLCDPHALESAFRGADLAAVEVVPIDVPTVFRDFDDYWSPFLGGQGPAPAYAMALDAAARDKLRDRIRADLPVRADGSIALVARAWAVRGTVDAPPARGIG
ncbi:MAG TPA: class I SAM-dependent methyltransferase [Casimicrobiaceae bacterium]|jgi:SAM-dependent methyltransferase